MFEFELVGFDCRKDHLCSVMFLLRQLKRRRESATLLTCAMYTQPSTIPTPFVTFALWIAFALEVHLLLQFNESYFNNRRNTCFCISHAVRYVYASGSTYHRIQPKDTLWWSCMNFGSNNKAYLFLLKMIHITLCTLLGIIHDIWDCREQSFQYFW